MTWVHGIINFILRKIMTCGIYLLKFIGTDKIYVGQGLDIEDRYLSHLRSLRKGTASVKMLEAYKTYGVPIQELLLECTEEELDRNENEAIVIFNAVDNGFNTLYRAEDMPSWKSLLKGEDGGTSVYSNELILQAAELMTNPLLSLVKISSITAIKVTTLRKIAQGAQHKWISEKYPEIWNKLHKVKELRNKNTHAEHGNAVKLKLSARSQGIIYPKVIHTNGKICDIDNLSEFCRVNNLQTANLRRVLTGERQTHKGWKVYKV